MFSGGEVQHDELQEDMTNWLRINFSKVNEAYYSSWSIGK